MTDNGWPMLVLIKTPGNDVLSCFTGCIVTIGIARMPSLKAKTPISRLGLSEDDLLRLHT